MIIVDESDPIDDVEPTFPYREIHTRRGVKIREAYEILDEIGRGKFGRVFRCRDKNSGLVLAAKVVTTRRKEERRNVEREIEIMKKLQHPRLIQLYDALEDLSTSEMCLVLEMVCGGELFDRVIQDEFVLTERACAVFVRQICEAVEYIHSQNILHLDMKPENVMCLSRKGNRIKIIDFGLARFYDPNKKLQVLFGTPEFVAPEVVNFEAIDYSTDMWSVGVITYVLLSGLSPFMGETDVETMANVTIAKYDFDDECFDDISDEAQDFISKLLVKDKAERMTASECLKHRWLLPRNPPKSSPAKTLLHNDGPVAVNDTAVVAASPLKLSESSNYCDVENILTVPNSTSFPSTSPSASSSSPSPSPFPSSSSSSYSPSPAPESTSKLETPPSSVPAPVPAEKIENGFDQVDSKLGSQLLLKSSVSTPNLSCSNNCSHSSGDQSESESGYSGSGHSDIGRKTPSSSSNYCIGSDRAREAFQNSRRLENSLELTKDNLRDFVARWTDTPYLFDSPKGIITHVCTESERQLMMDREGRGGGGGGGGGKITNNGIHQVPTHTHSQSNLSHDNSFDCGINIVNQIRRFSYQLHEELERMKNHCNKSLRKCSWSEVSVNAQ